MKEERISNVIIEFAGINWEFIREVNLTFTWDVTNEAENEVDERVGFVVSTET